VKYKNRNYTLINSIKFNIDIASRKTVDVYGRASMQTSDTIIRPLTIESFSWQKDIYAFTNDANQKLSNKFRELLDYLGPKILIADPYFINDIKQNELTESFNLSDCQISFLNAVALSAVNPGITELIIMGVNSKANNHFDIDDAMMGTTTDQRFIKYEKLFRDLIELSQLSTYLPPSTIHFKNAPKTFHSRYWFSFSDDKKKLEKCVIVTNSIGNMQEADFTPVTNKAQLSQIASRYIDLFNRSTNELSI